MDEQLTASEIAELMGVEDTMGYPGDDQDLGLVFARHMQPGSPNGRIRASNQKLQRELNHKNNVIRDLRKQIEAMKGAAA